MHEAVKWGVGRFHIYIGMAYPIASRRSFAAVEDVIVNTPRDGSNVTIAELEPTGPRGELATQLYEQFGKPLEPAHAGQFVAITADGRSLIGQTLLETTRQAMATFGPGSFVFKVGEGVVGTWR